MGLSLDRIIVDLPLKESFGLFTRLASQIESGFHRDDALSLFASLGALGEDEDFIIEPWVNIQGTRVPFVVDATRTSYGIEFLFMSAAPLSLLIEQAAKECQGASNLKVLKAMGQA